MNWSHVFYIFPICINFIFLFWNVLYQKEVNNVRNQAELATSSTGYYIFQLPIWKINHKYRTSNLIENMKNNSFFYLICFLKKNGYPSMTKNFCFLIFWSRDFSKLRSWNIDETVKEHVKEDCQLHLGVSIKVYWKQFSVLKN